MAGVVTPAVGDLLAERYSLAAHVDDDSSGRQVWRGMDVLLNRPVTVVLRTPGGVHAEEMLTAAVAASHVNHPNVVGVYDAVDQGDCAYIVREWVEGESLRHTLEATRLSCDDAVSIMHCVADAVAAVHATGVAHGNIHPGTILLSTDDRVVLTDPRADASATMESDIRAIGATLYCALTGTWPRTVIGPASLPDAPTDVEGQPLPPDVLRDDIPPRLNRMVCDLLAGVSPPGAAQVAHELSDVTHQQDGTGALALVTPPTRDETPALPPRIAGRRIAFGAAALAGLAILGLLAALVLIPSSPSDSPGGTDSAGNSNGGDNGNAPVEPTKLELTAEQVTVLDPDGEDTTAREGVENLVDGDTGTGWQTSAYFSENWGNFKEGMGLLLDLGENRQIVTVQVKMQDSGGDVGLYVGSADSPAAKPDDAAALADPITAAPTDLTFTISTSVDETRYLLVWCSNPPQLSDGNFQWTVNEIEVFTR